jgi:SAM-dependent methyltransferase
VAVTAAARAKWKGEQMPGGEKKIACPICGADRGITLLESNDVWLGFPGKFAVVRCECCGFVQSWPEMSVGEIAGYYPTSYYGEVPQALPPADRDGIVALGIRLFHQLQAGARRSRLALYTKPSVLDLALPHASGTGRLLDVGAGWGRFLAGAKAMGWQVEGLDFSPEIRRVGDALGIKVYQGELREHAGTLGRYELISFNHVLEHLLDPVETLALARTLLAPEGVVRIQVPLWRPGFVHIFGRYWFPLELPRHRWHFRVRDIEAMARLAGYTRVLAVPEIGVHPLQSSARLWMRDHPFWKRWQHWASVDNRAVRLLLLPLGWLLAVSMRPMEATFYLQVGEGDVQAKN